MSEWWTYRLSDFLMFSPRTYWRMVALYNQQYWPAQLLVTLIGLAAMRLAASQKVAAGRSLALILALGWLWVAWAFHWDRYAAINWAAYYLAAGCGLQALMFTSLGMADSPDRAAAATRTAPAGWQGKLGWTLAAAGLAYPLAALAAGRGWMQAEAWGFMPEPTALFTLGLLLASPWFNRRSRIRRTLLIAIPGLSLGIGAVTHCAMAG